MKEPKITLIIPIGNVEKHLSECLESIREQTLKEIEVICIDYGSLDDSLRIVEKFSKKDSRFKLISKPDFSYASSVNCGIEIANGEYIGIVKCEDFMVSEMYEKFYAKTFGNTADVIMGGFFKFIDQGDNAPLATRDETRDDIPAMRAPVPLKNIPQMLSGPSSIWCAIFHRDFLLKQKIRMDEKAENIVADELFFLETLCIAKKIFWLKETLYYHREGPQTSLYSDSPEILEEDEKDDSILPLKKIQSDIDIIKKLSIKDDIILRALYARAFSCCKYFLKRNVCGKNYEKINFYIQEIMRNLDQDIVQADFNLMDQKTYFEYLSPLKTISDKYPKILIYNWLPFDNPWGWGGGVTVYCRNVIDTFLKEFPYVQIYFLSSGFAYKATTTEIFYRQIDNIFGERVRQFEIVNSPVPADQRNLYNNPLVALKNKDLKNVFSRFLTQFGPFKAIHFNNIEGLSFDVLDLKDTFPDTQFIYSLHNYVPFCVTGSYYMRHKHCNCYPGHTGEDCFACVHSDIENNFSQKTYERGFVGVNKEQCVSKDYFCKILGFDRLDDTVYGDRILMFAQTATQKINKNCDYVLAVSKRVYDIAAAEGINKDKMIISYIGTAVAKKQVGKSLAQKKDGLKVVFLGSDLNYEEKGYPWLMKTLGQLDYQYAKKIDLVLTTRTVEHAEIYTICKDFRSVNVIQGYAHKDLGWILNDCDLGIVPVLWEDNLPQIAIEMVAYGVPILSSSAGGASELCDSSMFKFQSGDSKDFLNKLVHFLEKPDDLDEYWKHHSGLVTMHEHLEDLIQLYGLNQNMDDVDFSKRDYNYLLQEHDFLKRNFLLNELEPISTIHEDVNLVEKEQMQGQISYLQYVIDETRKSKSYKLGLALTAPVRKIRERRNSK